jgi:hypothetical protein
MAFRRVKNLVIGPRDCHRALSVTGCTNLVVSLCHRGSTHHFSEKDLEAIPKAIRDQLLEALKIEDGPATAEETTEERELLT